VAKRSTSPDPTRSPGRHTPRSGPWRRAGRPPVGCRHGGRSGRTAGVDGMAAAGMLILLVIVFWAAQSQTWAVTRIWAPLIRAAGDGTGKAVAFKPVLLSLLASSGGLLLLAAMSSGAYVLFGEPFARAAALSLGTAYAP